MAVIGRILGLGRAAEQIGGAVGNVAEVFVGNRAEREAADHARQVQALEQFGSEFTTVGSGRFDRFVNGLNRLPRPLMTLGTLGLFVHAMVDPDSFSSRMTGLARVPDQMWWLLGVIVSFYFGAREMHHRRARLLAPVLTGARDAMSPEAEMPVPTAGPLPKTANAPGKAPDPAAPAPAPAAFVAPPKRPAAPAVDPRPRPAAAAATTPVPEFDPADPDFNAAVEEWRRSIG